MIRFFLAMCIYRFFSLQISGAMDEAMTSSDKSMYDVQDLARRQQILQTNFIRNQQRVETAREASSTAKAQADAANAVLYQLNNDFKNVTSILDSKSSLIQTDKSRALDLQKRASDLASSASNKLTNIRGEPYII